MSPIIASDGHNLSSDSTCLVGGGTDLINTNPRLAPSDNYGGPTKTMALCARQDVASARGGLKSFQKHAAHTAAQLADKSFHGDLPVVMREHARSARPRQALALNRVYCKPHNGIGVVFR